MNTSMNLIQNINRIKLNDHLNRYRKTLGKNSTSFITKALKKLEREGSYLNIMEDVYHKLIANIVLNEEK
jgi:hypothetical protein